MFELHPQLAADTIFVRELELTSLRLMNASALPWVVLVPRRVGVFELIDLTEEDQQQLMREISFVGRIIREEFGAHKLNIASLGNMVGQLHVHIIARYKEDAAWPKPVWGNMETEPYAAHQATMLVQRLSDLCKDYPRQ